MTELQRAGNGQCAEIHTPPLPHTPTPYTIYTVPTLWSVTHLRAFNSLHTRVCQKCSMACRKMCQNTPRCIMFFHANVAKCRILGVAVIQRLSQNVSKTSFLGWWKKVKL